MRQLLRNSTVFMLAVVFGFINLTIGCKSNAPTQEATGQNAGQGLPQNPPAPQMSVDDLVAPIALYPDQLLAQVLTTAVNPQEVLDLGNWLLQNQNLQGDAMTNAAKQAGFSPSAQYLALFPQVVDNMCQQMDWTRQLGEAFNADQKGVMDAVQRKRTQAQQMGNLTSSPQMTVATKQADNGQRYVEIQPANPKVVYVPQYNPVTIYNTQAAPSAVRSQTTTTATTKSGVSTGTAVAIGLLSFGVGMAVGSAINSNNYYPYPAWGYHSVYVVNRPYYPPPYRPPVYPGYRPVYGYNPPPNYQWYQYNVKVNVNVNNNYYTRFNSASTLPANTRPAYGNNPSTLPANARPAPGDQPNWKGQTTYQGARPTTTQGQNPRASTTNAVPGNQQFGQRPNNQTAANRSNTGNASPPNTAPNRPNNGNAGGMNRGASNPNTAVRPAPQPNMNRGGDRGYAAASPSTRPVPSAAPAARPAPAPSPSAQNQPNTNGGGGAFGGANVGNAKSERAASNRGRSSMGASGRGAGKQSAR
jgi:Protein of unknown function (DUF3300)